MKHFSFSHQFWLMSLLYVVIAIGMTWPLALHLDSALTENADTLQQTWILAWNAHALAHDPLQVWHAPIFYPYPSTAAYHDHHLILSLLAAPVIWLSNNPVLAHNLLVLLSFVVAGWGGYTLSRALGAQPGVAFVGGLIFAFSTYRFAHIMQLNLLQSGWMALAMAALVRFLQPEEAGGGSWRDALRVGFWSGLQAAYDDRPIRLVEGALPVNDGRVRFEVDLLNPQAAWMTERGKPEDGRYIAYLVNPDDPDDQGLPVAQFQLVGGVLQQAQIVVLPLTGVIAQ